MAIIKEAVQCLYVDGEGTRCGDLTRHPLQHCPPHRTPEIEAKMRDIRRASSRALELASNRLVALHLDEFMTILAEEYERAGLPAPKIEDARRSIR